ncbi:hypothetical protein H0E87_009337 [Populus deltoides]|uniref:Bet v I/Major latex protein domain-containing protein n=1 Tax=Populus deltoides TaxID=3696 RepID=A0A8T2Z3U2_POPDE|nr:hypothetical protein H0E87_009337 [Populus deltoides]
MLKFLSICDLTRDDGSPNDCQVVTCGTNLKFFSYSGELKTDFCLYSSSLVNGCMDLRSVTVSEWDGKQREAAYHVRKLLKGFSSVESLTVSPVALETIGLVDSNKSWVNTVGSRKVIEILSAESCRDTAEKFKYIVEAIDDRSRKITYKLLEGSLLQLYDNFTVTLQVTSASTAKWTIEYQKKKPTSEDPDFYLKLFPTINATVDIYLRSNDD